MAGLLWARTAAQLDSRLTINELGQNFLVLLHPEMVVIVGSSLAAATAGVLRSDGGELRAVGARGRASGLARSRVGLARRGDLLGL